MVGDCPSSVLESAERVYVNMTGRVVYEREVYINIKTWPSFLCFQLGLDRLDFVSVFAAVFIFQYLKKVRSLFGARAKPIFKLDKIKKGRKRVSVS